MAQLVALPFELQVSVNEAFSRQTMISPLGGGRRGTFFDIGYWQPTLPQVTLPETHFYVEESSGVLVGVPNPRTRPVGTRTLDIFRRMRWAGLGLGYEESHAPTIQEVTEATPWALQHDFRKFHAEVVVLGRLLTELSALLPALVAPNLMADGADQVIAIVPDRGFCLRDELIAHLLAGGSIYELPGVAAFLTGCGPVEGQLLFDVMETRFASPLWSKLKAYLNFDKTINTSTLLAAMSLLFQIHAALAPPLNPPLPPHNEIHITITQVAPQHQDDAARSVGRAVYLRDLKDGGVRKVQTFLRILGYDPGPVDGDAGPRTEAAVQQFCAATNTACESHLDEAFQYRLADEMATQHPVIVSQK